MEGVRGCGKGSSESKGKMVKRLRNERVKGKRVSAYTVFFIYVMSEVSCLQTT